MYCGIPEVVSLLCEMLISLFVQVPIVENLKDQARQVPFETRRSIDFQGNLKSGLDKQ
jgi:hypothetical protein